MIYLAIYRRTEIGVIMKRTMMLTALLSFSLVSYAGFNVDVANQHRVYICTLQPFQDVFADVGITEDISRYKVQRRCEKSRGNGSIFCKPLEAKCIESSILLGINTDRNSGVNIYSDGYFSSSRNLHN